MSNICNWLIIYSLWQNWVWTLQTVVESDEEIEAEEDDEKEDKKSTLSTSAGNPCSKIHKT